MAAVSAIIPAYNAAAKIGSAIESVLSQTFQDFEVIVVDDGSQDDTAGAVRPFLKDPRIHYIAKRNGGASSAKNLGAGKSIGKYLLFLDADDSLSVDAVGTMYQRFQDTGAAWAIVGVLKVIGQQRVVRKAVVPTSDPLLALLDNDFVTRSPFYPREEFFAIGMYDEQLRTREDWDINIRMCASNRPFVVIDQPLYWYSRTEGSLMTGNRRKVNVDTEMLLRKHHKRLADAGNKEAARCYAKNMWELARQYFYNMRDYREASRCLYESMRYDPSLTRLIHPLIHRIETAVDRR